MKKTLQKGKLPSEFLNRLIHNLPPASKELIVPPGVGRDAAGLQLGDNLIAVTTDPITFATDAIATYSVAVNINDIACLGCKPRFYSGVLLLPPNTTEDVVEKIWQELTSELDKYAITAIGGHVEVTDSVNQPLLIGQMIGEAIVDELLDPVHGKPGDVILLWQRISIEGTALIALEKPSLLQEHFSSDEIRKMQRLLKDPGICIWPFVKKLLPQKGIIALHDPTEGGVATAIHEVCDACGCGVEIDFSKISILPETEKLSQLLNFNPLGLLASGCLLMVCKAEDVDVVLNKLPNEPLVKIGRLTKGSMRHLLMDDEITSLPRFDTDELVSVFSDK